MKYIVYFHYGKGDVITETQKIETNEPLYKIDSLSVPRNEKLTLLKIEIIVNS